MATILELAQMSQDVYKGSQTFPEPSGPLLHGLSGNWQVFMDSNTQNSSWWLDGYFGVAYRNTVTGEIVIANRGTDTGDGLSTTFKNLASDLSLSANVPSAAQKDAALFAQSVMEQLKALQITPTSVIETGHSLGGTEAQSGLAFLVDQNLLPGGAAEGSAVIFNAPGIGGWKLKSAPQSYNVVDLYDQGDVVHLAGFTHLGGTGNLVNLAAGPDTSKLAVLAPLAVASGPLGILALLGGAAYETFGAAHPIATQFAYLSPGGGGSAIGSINWMSSSNAASIGGSPVNSSLPAMTVNANGNIVLVDPTSNISTTLSLPSDAQHFTGVFSGGTSPVAQALATLGVVSVPIPGLGENFSAISGASAIEEDISRVSSNNYGVSFKDASGPLNPAAGDQFVINASIANAAFDYVVPTTGQTVTETIDNGSGNGTGSITVLGSTANVLIGGAAVNGEAYTWEDFSSDVYVFSPASPGSNLGALTISNSSWGSPSNQIIVNNFDVQVAHTGVGFLGIVLPETISIGATADVGGQQPSPNFIQGSSQSYTLSVDAPPTTAQTLTVTLTGPTPSDFRALVGNTVEQLNANGSFNVTMAPNETSVSFTLIDTTPDDGSSDIASGANLTLSASLANPDTLVGGNIQSSSLTFKYVTVTPANAPSPQPTDVIAGTLSGGITTFAGDGGDDFMTGTGTSNLFNAQNSGNDSLVAGTGTNTINGGNGNSVMVLHGTSNTVVLGSGYNTVSGSTGNDIVGGGSGDENISGNGGADLVVLGNGNSQIYAGAQTSLATAIAATTGGTASGVKGDLIAVGDGSNTVVGGNGNDLINVGAGNDVIVMGPGSDTFLGGTEVTQAVVGWSATVAAPTLTGGTWTLTENGVTGYAESFTNTFPQPYNGSTGVGPADDTIFGGKGNEFLELGNGNNYVETGNGSDTVLGGMGNDTIILGSGADTVRGGGGTTYIAGGSGHDFIQGGDGDNTIIGGSGNSTLLAAAGPNGTTQFTGANLEQNYVFGGSGSDKIQGSAGSDTLIGGTGNTTITGVSGNENIIGGSGNDLLNGGTGNNTIAAGGAGRDTLFAIGSSTSTSILYGGTGTDLISGGSGANTLYAGDGGIAGGATTVFASQTDAAATTTIFGGLGIDLLEGGAGTAVIYAGDGGTATAHTSILAGSGNATIYGGLGTDIIEGGAGTDMLYAGDGGTSSAPTTVGSGTGVDTLFGGAGVSILQDIQAGDDLLISGSANDTMIGVGSDTLIAGIGNDQMQVNSGSVNFQFNDGFGNDTIASASGTANVLLGTGIADTDLTGALVADGSTNIDLTLSGDGGSIDMVDGLTGVLSGASNVGGTSIALPTFLSDVLGGDQSITNAFGGSDIVSVANGESVALTHASGVISSWGTNASLSGTSGTIYAVGASALITSGGSNRINAAGAGATVNGGVSDQVTLSGANSLANVGNGSTITINGTNDTVTSASGVTSTITINDGSAVLQITGGGVTSVQSSVSYTAPTNVTNLTLIGSANITAMANSAADHLTGGAGNDTLVSGSGVDTLTGGSGTTTYVVNNSSDVIQVGGIGTVQSSVSFSLLTNLNTLILTGTAALTGTANTAADTIVSNSGIDTLIGGAGKDTFIVNNPLDVVEDTAGTATIIYSSSAAAFTLPVGSNTLTLTGTTAIQATGNAANDLITANSGADTLVAGNGVDTLISGVGAAVQSLVGGTGNDLFVVNFAGDIVNVGATHGTDTIQSSVSYTAAANVADLTLIGTSALVATGNSLVNILTANSGADTLVGGSGVATLFGGVGNDTFVVNSTADVVKDTSSLAINTLSSSVNYTLPTDVSTLVFTGTAALVGTANTANDTLTSNSGADTLFGSSGNDTFIVTNAGVVVKDTSATAKNAIFASVSYTLPTDVNSLSLTGTAALQGTGNSANDLLTANTGADTLVAGNGSDTLVSGAGTAADSLVGGTGSDLFIVSHAADVVSVGAAHGADTIQSSLSYTLPANVATLALTGSANLVGAALSGNNSIVGNSGNDTLRAGSGNDTLVSGSGIDTLVGGSSADTFVINNAADVMVSLSATANTIVSSINYTLGANTASLILQGTANLVGTGNSVANSLRANNGNDTLVAAAGVSSLFGGLGSDLFIINNVADVVSDPDFAQKAGIDTIQSSVSYTLPSTVNILVLSGTASLSGHGNSGADELVGNGGADVLTAGNGNSTLIAGSGLSTLIGGSGNNTFVIDNTGDAIQETVGTHNNVLFSSVTYTLPTNINTMILTGSANLTATANSGNDSIRGNAGADVLQAGAGSDTLAAGSGLVTLVGGSGADTFIIDNFADVIQSASASVQNALYSSVSYTLPTNVNVLTLTGAANIQATGNSAADTLIAGAGQDTLVAGAGAATLIGGSYNDTFIINSASDLVQDSVTGAANTVLSSVSTTLVANVNSLVLTGTAALAGGANSANDTLTSNSGADTLTGGAGNDTFVVSNLLAIVQDTTSGANNTLISSVNYSLPTNVNALILTGTAALQGMANGGNDTLTSNSGADTLFGGAGNDTFIVNASQVVVSDAFATSNLIESAVSYTLPTNINALTLIGTAAMSATGNAAPDVIRASSGADTLVAGGGVATLFGGSGQDTFIVNNVGDVVQDSFAVAGNSVIASVSYSLVTNVNVLTLSGTAALVATANSAGDSLVSNSGVDTLVGGAGADLFIVNNSADLIVGATAADTIESSVNFSLPTGATNLVLLGSANIVGTGNASSDRLTAGSGNDTLIAGAGVTTMVGGSGNDTFVVNSSSDIILETATNTSSQVLSSSVFYSLPANVDFLTLTGSAALQAFGNTDLSNVLTANAGNDRIFGTAVNNTINGGVGADSLYAGPEDNLFFAGSGGTAPTPTFVYGNWPGTNFATQSTIYGGSGTDVLYGGPGSDIIYGGTGVDSLYAGTGFDSLYGAAGDLLVDTLSGLSLLTAGAGSETLIGTGTDTFVAGSGTDQLSNFDSLGSSTSYDFAAGSGQTTIGVGSFTFHDPETLNFGTGLSPSTYTVSIVQSPSGGDELSGVGLKLQNGSQSIVINSAFESNAVSALDFADTGNLTFKQFMNTYGPGSFLFTNNAFIWSGTTNATNYISTGNGKIVEDAADLIWASGENDYISSAVSDDSFQGFNPPLAPLVSALGDNDTLIGQTVWTSGNNDWVQLIDSMGGATLQGANDTVSNVGNQTAITVYQASDVIQSGSEAANDSLSAFVNYTLPAHFTQLTLAATVAGLAATSNSTGGLLIAGGNFDTLTGGAGVDTLFASGSNDLLIGGSGTETYALQNATDTIQFGTGAASLTSVRSAVSYTLTSAANNLTLTAGTIVGAGNTANDSMVAVASSDTLVAGSGNDTLVASNTSQRLIGGAGNDTFIVIQGTVVVDNATTGNNTVLATTGSFALPANVNNLVLNQGFTSGTANNANDSLVANGGSNTLIAGTGNDTLVAAAQSTTFDLNSGYGQDLIVASQPNDVIQFGTGIAESSLTFTALAGTGPAAPSFVITGAGNPVTVQGGLVPGAISSIDFTGGLNYTIPQLLAPTGRTTVTGSLGNLVLSSTASDVVTGGAGQDTLIGWGNSDTLSAGTGGTLIYAGGTGNSIVGGAGSDTLDAIGTSTTLKGGTGNETFVINSASDVLQAAAAGHNSLLSSINYTLPTNVNTLTLSGTAALSGTGNAASDTITGNSGNDTLVAGTGAALLVGKSLADTFVINNATDTVTAAASSNDTIVSSLSSYTLPASVNNLILGSGDNGTGNTGNDLLVGGGSGSLTAGSGSDTLQGRSGDSLIAGSGSDLMIGLGSASLITASTHADTLQSSGTHNILYINNSADVITSLSNADTISSSVNFTFAGDASTVSFATWNVTGTAALVASNQSSAPATIVANSAFDTLVGGAEGGTFIDGAGGAMEIGGDLQNSFTVNHANDVIVASAGATNTVNASINYTLPSNVNFLNFTGTAALIGHGNAGNDSLTANSGADTLVAGNGNDTLNAVFSAVSMVGGTGNDLFIVGNPSDTVTVGATHGDDTVKSSVSMTAPANVANLVLTGGGALTGTGNSITDLINANFGTDTLVGGTGIAVLEGNTVSGTGSDVLKATGNQAALIAGVTSATLTGGAFKDFYAAGKVSDSITTGATANVVSINTGDGATTLNPTTSASNVLSLGAGIDTESLFFTKTGNNLILTDGVSGDSITFTNWYVGAADQDYTTLQVVEIASANYNAAGGDGLRNKALELFNFTALVAAYNAAGSPANWALSTAMPTVQLTSSSTADYGGDLAYYFGLNGNLTGVNLSAAASTLTNASYATAQQTIDSFSSISGGGLHLLVSRPEPNQSITAPLVPQEQVGVQLRPGADEPINIGVPRLIGSNSGQRAVFDPNSPVGVFDPLAPRLGIAPRVPEVPSGVGAQLARSPDAAEPRVPAPADNAITFATLVNSTATELPRSIAPEIGGLLPRLGLQSNLPPVPDSLTSTEGSITPHYGIDLLANADLGKQLPIFASGPLSSLEMPVGWSTIGPVTATASAELVASDLQDSQPQSNIAAIIADNERSITPRFGAVPPATPQATLSGTAVNAITAADLEGLSAANSPMPIRPTFTNGRLISSDNFVDATNVAWLTLHSTLDQAAAASLGGAEPLAESTLSASEALLAGSVAGHDRRPIEETDLNVPVARRRAM